MGALETYLTDIRDTKLSGEGVSELSYYPALRNLLEEVGGGLKPKVRCFMNLRNRGAGLPDGGLFTADQVRRQSRAGRSGAPAEASPSGPIVPDEDGLQLSLLSGQKPARGAIEVKPPSANVDAIAKTEQVLGYLEAYRQVLVTNLREFLLLAVDDRGAPVVLERYRIAPNEAEFWAAADHPRRTEQEHGERFQSSSSGYCFREPHWPHRRIWPGSWLRMRARRASLPNRRTCRRWTRCAGRSRTDWESSSRAQGESIFSALRWFRPSSTACSPPGSSGATTMSLTTAPTSTGEPPPGPCMCRWCRRSSLRSPLPICWARCNWCRFSSRRPRRLTE